MEWRGGPYPRATANLSHQAPMNTVAVSTANPVECQHGCITPEHRYRPAMGMRVQGVCVGSIEKSRETERRRSGGDKNN